jgi:hypothetical protein
LYILENLQIQSLQEGKDQKKRRIVLNGGIERMELKKLEKQGQPAHILEECRRKCVGRQGYEFMTVYDAIVSMGVEAYMSPVCLV